MGLRRRATCKRCSRACPGRGPTDNEREITHSTGQDSVAQVAKYIQGVGDVHNVLARAVEGATGIGLLARIIRGYTYLSREFQPGDHIVMVGFSRGAYTARALAGFVAGQGLLDWTAMQLTAGTDLSYSAGLAAWEAYKRARNAASHGILQGLDDVVTSLQISACTRHRNCASARTWRSAPSPSGTQWARSAFRTCR